MTYVCDACGWEYDEAEGVYKYFEFSIKNLHLDDKLLCDVIYEENKLYKKGYKGIIFDVDNTLVHHGTECTKEVGVKQAPTLVVFKDNNVEMIPNLSRAENILRLSNGFIHDYGKVQFIKENKKLHYAVNY